MADLDAPDSHPQDNDPPQSEPTAQDAPQPDAAAADQNTAPPPPPPPPGNAANAPRSSIENPATWAMFCHLAALSFFVGIPFGNIVGPVIIWVIKKDEMPIVNDQGKEAINFQILMTIIISVLGVSVIIPLVGCFTIMLLLAAIVVDMVFIIIAGIEASKGATYRYPFNWRIIQ